MSGIFSSESTIFMDIPLNSRVKTHSSNTLSNFVIIFANRINLCIMNGIPKKSMEITRINRLKAVLAEQNRTGKWLAGQLGKNEATISRWCSNTSQPSLEMLIKIANILNVDAKNLINNGIKE